MNELIIVHLQSFIRTVREAQGISQKELSENLGISQSAVAQYEKTNASLSQNTLKKAANLLNLNPDFLQNGSGNPFKQAKENEVIKIFFPTTQTGEIDFTLLNYIADYNRKAVFVFLKPSDFPEMTTLRVRKWQAKELTTYALAVRDSDENVFIFKRKNDLFFNERDLIMSLKKKEADQQKFFNFSIANIGEDLYKQIKQWGKIDASDINRLFIFINGEDYLRFINEVISRAAIMNLSSRGAQSVDFKKMEKKLGELPPSIVNATYELIINNSFDLLKNLYYEKVVPSLRA